MPRDFLAVDLVSRYRAVPAGTIDRVVISPGLGSGLRPLGMYSSVGGVFEALDVAHRVLVEAL